MPTRTTGRRLDDRGHPIEGSGFSYDSDGALAQLLAQRNSPLISQPITGEWVFGLVAASQTGGEFERGVGIFPPGNAGPPEHFHPIYDEHFTITQGQFIFRINGAERTVRAGEQLVVPTKTPHTFRCTGNELGVIVVETRPAARISQVISTLRYGARRPADAGWPPAAAARHGDRERIRRRHGLYDAASGDCRAGGAPVCPTWPPAWLPCE